MGNAESAVVQKRLARFCPEDRLEVERIFHRLQSGARGPSGGQEETPTSKTITLEMLQSSMGCLVSDFMIKKVYQCMCGIDPGLATHTRSGKASTSAVSGVCREQLIIFLADMLQGTAEERAPLVMAMSQCGKETIKVVSCEQVTEFLQDLILAVVQILVNRGHLEGWKPEKMDDCSLGVKLLAEQMCSELKPLDQGGCDVSCLEHWLCKVSQVSLYLQILVAESLNVYLSARPAPTLLPPCRETPWEEFKCLLGLPTVMFLAQQLPDCDSAPWRLVFSTQLHGESFTRMVSSLIKCGPTILLIKDSKGYVFGGFASHTWEIRPQFQGDSRCFLFTVFPRLTVYTATGYNQHFMYLNHNQQTMPNGLGMGGQHGYFGLWLDSDFGHGHSRAQPKCTTYASPQLSGEEDFILDSVEVWAVGKPQQSDESEEGMGKKSILDANLETQAIMEIAGKTLHSRGFRAPEEDQEH